MCIQIYTNSSANNTSRRAVRLTWTAYDGALKYRVFRQDGEAWIKLGDAVTEAFTDQTAVSGEQRVYTVRAIGADGSYLSDFCAGGYAFTYIAAPVITKADNAVGGVDLKWTASQGAAKYRVFRKTTGTWKRLADTASTEYCDKTAVSGTTYTYTVRCMDEEGAYNSAYHDGVTVRYIAAPVITKIDNNNVGAVIKWKAVPGAAQYRVFYRTYGTKWSKLGDTDGLTYTHTNPAFNKTYAYTVRCLSADSLSYTSAADLQGRTNKLLATPVITAAKPGFLYLSLSWKTVAGAKAYRVYCRGGKYKSWTILTDTVHCYADLDNDLFVSNTAYAFTVRCVSASGDSHMSGFSVKGTALRWYDTPQIAYITNTAKGMELYWTKVKGVASYRVFEKVDGKWKKLADVAGTGLRVTGVKSSKSAIYCYTVRGMDQNGNYVTAYDEAGRSFRYYKTVYSRRVHVSTVADHFKQTALKAGFIFNSPAEIDWDRSYVRLLDYTGCYGASCDWMDDMILSRGDYLIDRYAAVLKRNNETPADYTFRILTDADSDKETAFCLSFSRIKN